MSGHRKITWTCADTCGWRRTVADERVIEFCPSCGARAHWALGEQPLAPPATALSYLRRALADVIGEQHARYAPALLTWLTQARVAVVPHELRDDCPLWGRRGILTRRLGRGVHGTERLNAALEAVLAVREANEGEAQLAGITEARWLADRAKRAG